MAERRRLVLALVAVVMILFAGERGLGWYGWRHFGPSQKLDAALAAGASCFVITGDSRMAAGLSIPAFRENMRSGGSDPCVADLSLGGTGLAGQTAEVRAYLARRGGGQTLIVGVVAESLLPLEETDPAGWTGNNAVVLQLSESSDAEVHFPIAGIPSIRTLDRRERFYMERLSSYGVYRSLLWARVQGLQDRVAGRVAAPRNNFGALGDMATLEKVFRRTGGEALKKWQASDTPGFDPWFSLLRAEAERRKIPLVVVELPMPTSYRHEITESAGGQALRRALAVLLEGEGGRYLDLSAQPWFTDSMLSDGIHLSAAGAIELSRDLGAALSVGHQNKTPMSAPNQR